MSVRFLARSGKKLNLDSKSDQIPSRISGGISGSKSVVNMATCRIIDTHKILTGCRANRDLSKIKTAVAKKRI